MEQNLIQLYCFRRVKWDEVRDVLHTLNHQLVLVGKEGSRRLVPDVTKYSADNWKKACEGGYVYLLSGERWAWSPDLDDHTNLPVLMAPYKQAFPEPPPPPAPPPVAPQGELQLDKPADEATTQQP